MFNGIAGIINIFCMTGWWSVYASEDKTDMLWPDMTWVYIIAYDIWNFCYTYNCLPTHSFCNALSCAEPAMLLRAQAMSAPGTLLGVRVINLGAAGSGLLPIAGALKDILLVGIAA